MEIVALPVSTYFLSRFPLATLPVMVSLTIAYIMLLWQARGRIVRDQVVWFGALWMVFALAPVILIVAERTTYFSSVGWAWVLAATVILAWDAAPLDHLASRRKLALLALVGFLGANVVALNHRSYWWNRVANISRDAFSQVKVSLVELGWEKGSQLWLVNPPRHIEYAEALGNRTLFGVWLLQGQLGTDVKVALLQDREIEISPTEDMRQLLSTQPVKGPVIAFYWQGENLVKLSTRDGTLPP
jgi:hypothetical protein